MATRQWMTPVGFVVDEDGTSEYMLPGGMVVEEKVADPTNTALLAMMTPVGFLFSEDTTTALEFMMPLSFVYNEDLTTSAQPAAAALSAAEIITMLNRDKINPIRLM